jgi:hypothetical protein
MRIICSWCKKYMGEKEPLNDPTETSGICDTCLAAIEKEQNVVREEIKRSMEEKQ